MTSNAVQSLAFVLLLAVLPLTSLGTTFDLPWLWWTGLGLLVIGGLLPPATRLGRGRDEDDER